MKVNELRAEIVRQELTTTDVANKMGMNKSTFWRKLKEPDKFTLSDIVAIKQVLDLDNEKIMNVFFG